MKRKLSRRIAKLSFCAATPPAFLFQNLQCQIAGQLKQIASASFRNSTQPAGQFVSARSGIYAPQSHQSTTLLKPFSIFSAAQKISVSGVKNTQSETFHLFRTRERFDWRRGSLILSSISAVNHLFLFLPEERLVRLPSESDKETPVSASISDRRVRVVD